MKWRPVRLCSFTSPHPSPVDDGAPPFPSSPRAVSCGCTAGSQGHHISGTNDTQRSACVRVRVHVHARSHVHRAASQNAD